MHETSFAEVSCPSRHVVLKFPLRDFSLGHRLLLLRQENPLYWSAENHFNSLPFHEQVMWLIEAVFICTHTYRHRQALEQPSLFNWRRKWNWMAVKLWHWQLRGCPVGIGSLKIRFVSDVDWPSEILAFRNYLNASRIITEYDDRRAGFPFLPCTPTKESGGRALGGPLDAALVQFLVSSRLCSNQAKAMEYPLGAAEIHYYTHMEREGVIRIINAQEMAFEEDSRAKDLEAARAAGFETVADYMTHIKSNVPQHPLGNKPPANNSGLATPPPDLSHSDFGFEPSVFGKETI